MPQYFRRISHIERLIYKVPKDLVYVTTLHIRQVNVGPSGITVEIPVGFCLSNEAADVTNPNLLCRIPPWLVHEFLFRTHRNKLRGSKVTRETANSLLTGTEWGVNPELQSMERFVALANTATVIPSLVAVPKAAVRFSSGEKAPVQERVGQVFIGLGVIGGGILAGILTNLFIESEGVNFPRL
ncbi:hypothetical protein KIPB_000897 [Kipferlia bialata]|uniref:Uncharacterized protein n=1 Tax=Kipferlia bialata TaxID=797122 RepID=A0A9K3CN00_9EUKA|nr:hypothetical protein KIPB_000897 [Kipferlia bialata]|eukprot:g897.t1